MKKLLSLTLALLMSVMLLGVGGAKNYACAEEDPYVGLWEITGYQQGDTFIAFSDSGNRAYMDFLANGVIYGVMVGDSGADLAYMGYKVTGENALDIYEGDDPLPAAYDPATGVITVTDTDSGLVTFVERVKEDPLPDIRAMVADPQQEQTYYGYRMTQADQTINMLEMLPAVGMDPKDFCLTLSPDGTGHIQFGEEASGDITWTETEFTADGESISYTRMGDHIVIDMGENQGSIEFAPQGEAEILMLLLGGTETIAASMDVEDSDLVGEWQLAKAVYSGVTLTSEQIQQQGLEMSFVFNADGTASMTSNGTTTNGIDWTLDGNVVNLTLYSTKIPFDITFDGEYLILDYMAQIYFEKVN
ncbi:MAG: hypothetical protein IJI82_02120 [Clostridia bacterium]|nr:hypothetical protein [Clostridia bacterium]